MQKWNKIRHQEAFSEFYFLSLKPFSIQVISPTSAFSYVLPKPLSLLTLSWPNPLKKHNKNDLTAHNSKNWYLLSSKVNVEPPL